MGLADREYQRQHPHPASRLTPVVKALLWTNVAIFILDYLVLPILVELPRRDLGLPGEAPPLPPLLSWGAFTVESAIRHGHVWEFLTFQFLHASLGHVLFNCMGLYFFGPWIEKYLGAKRFTIFYLICGAAGAGLCTALTLLKLIPGDIHTPLVGASAGIYGIFIGVAIIAPNLRVALLFPPIELSMRQMAIALVIISLVLIQTGWFGNQGGEAGHMGGFLAGFLLMKFPRLLGRKPTTVRPIRRDTGPAKLRPRPYLGGPIVDPEIDRILDKISREGIHSVTAEERELLRKLSETNHDS